MGLAPGSHSAPASPSIKIPAGNMVPRYEGEGKKIGGGSKSKGAHYSRFEPAPSRVEKKQIHDTFLSVSLRLLYSNLCANYSKVLFYLENGCTPTVDTRVRNRDERKKAGHIRSLIIYGHPNWRNVATPLFSSLIFSAAIEPFSPSYSRSSGNTTRSAEDIA